MSGNPPSASSEDHDAVLAFANIINYLNAKAKTSNFIIVSGGNWQVSISFSVIAYSRVAKSWRTNFPSNSGLRYPSYAFPVPPLNNTLTLKVKNYTATDKKVSVYYSTIESL